MIFTTPKFKVGDTVRIMAGTWKDDTGEILEQTDCFAGEFRYKVFLKEHPNENPVLIESVIAHYQDCYLEGFENVDHYKDGFEPFFEMSSIRGGFKNIKLAVFGGEGDLPHFHFFHNVAADRGIPQEKAKGGGCLCILEPKYFMHSGHTETLTSDEIKELIKFLKSPMKNIDISIWTYIINLWNDNNEDRTQVPIDAKIPNYHSGMDNIHSEK